MSTYLSSSVVCVLKLSGVGALYVRNGVELRKLIYGAHNHESGQRAGTENVILVVGLGEACEIAHRFAHLFMFTESDLYDFIYL